jgi:hypothetical protein
VYSGFTVLPSTDAIIAHSSLMLMRPPTATLITSPLARGAAQARRTPSTTFAT